MNEQKFYKEIEAHFNLRSNKTKKPEMVYLVVRIDGRQYKLSCGVKVYPQHWHKGIAEESNMLCARDNKNNRIVNKKLIELKKRYSEFIAYICNCDNDITDMGDLLKQFIYKDMCNNKSVIDYINEAFNDYYGKKATKATSRKNYKRDIDNYFVAYVNTLQNKGINVLKQEGFTKWVKWLQDNATGNVANRVTQLIVRLINNIAINNPSLGLQPPLYEKKQTKNNTQKKNEGKPLSKEEMEAFNNYIPKNDTQKAVKILFQIGLLTGARSSDWNKFINGDYEVKKDSVLLIQPKKTNRNEATYAYVTLTPKLQELINEAKEMGIHYVDREELDNAKGKGNKYKCRVVLNTFVRNLQAICKAINKDNNNLFGKEVYATRNHELQLVPSYDAISSHWARHTFVHECKMQGLSNEVIAKKIGDSVKMVEDNYGYMNKTEIAEQMINAEQNAQKENKAQKEITVSNGFFAYDDVIVLADRLNEGINIYDDSRLTKVVNVVRSSVSKKAMDKAIKMLQNADENKQAAFKNKVTSDKYERFIWEVGKYLRDTKLYMEYQYKLKKLGLLDGEPLSDEIIGDWWQAELSVNN